MKQTSRKLIVAGLIATVVGVASIASAQQANDTWQAGGAPLRSGDGTLCWNDNYATPATVDAKCGKAAPKAAEVVSSKVTLNSIINYNDNKSILNKDQQAQLVDLAGKIKSITVEVIIVKGHTDNRGGAAYNKRLSAKRAEVVKAFLVKNGIERGRIYTEGVGAAEPSGDNKTASGREANRRVTIEVIGTRKN